MWAATPADRSDTVLPEVFIDKHVQQRIDRAVGVAEYSEQLEHENFPARNLNLMLSVASFRIGHYQMNLKDTNIS